MKLSLRKYLAPFLLGFIVAVLVALVVGAVPQSAGAQTEPTYEFLLEKKISDNKPVSPYTADEFTFNVSGYGTVNLTASTNDYASAIVMLPAGDYTVAEVGPTGFVEADWTVQWSGYGCENGNGPVFSTSMTVSDDATGNVCRADNQFRGEPEPILGCTDPDALNYDPAAEEDDGSCIYDNGGGNGTSTDLYRIEGYVWHDTDQNGEWIQENENPLEGWMVTITNSSTTATTTTDGTGYYYFDVEVGTWTLFETVQTDWSQSHPSSPETYVVTVPVEGMTLGFPLNIFFTVAHAAVIETYSGYNFGNYFTGDNGGGGNNGGDDGGGSSNNDYEEGSIASGCYNCAGGNGGGNPQVLGEQVTAVPALAPYAGHGGTSLNLPSFLAFAWPLLAWFGF